MENQMEKKMENEMDNFKGAIRDPTNHACLGP